MPSHAVKREIVDLEHESWKALQKSGKALFPFLAKDCCMIFPGGTIFSKDSNPTLAEILTRDDMKPWASFTIAGERVTDLGEYAKSISYVVEAKRDNEVYDALVTSIWRKDEALKGGNGEDLEGDWLLVLHQQTPV